MNRSNEYYKRMTGLLDRIGDDPFGEEAEKAARTEMVKRILKFATEADRHLWEIGDALIKEIGEQAEFRECSKALAERGYEINARRLRELRDVAQAFPENHRRDDLSWAIHQEAMHPDNLDRIVEAYPREELTLRHVRLVMQVWRRTKEGT